MQMEMNALKSANQMLDRKVKAEQLERNSNMSMISGQMPQGNRFHKINQTLNKSILDHSMASVGNTSIMDIMSGYKGGNTSDWGGKKKKKGPALQGAPKDLNKSYFSGYNDLSDSGEILKVEAFSDSDSDDCQIVTDGPQENNASFSSWKKPIK